jgi:hypothetical protein
MATGFRNFVRAFGNFILAFGDNWFVAMSGSLGVPLMISGYFVARDAAQVILFFTGIVCLIFSSFWVWNREHEARRKAEALVSHNLIDIKQSSLFLDPRYEVWKAKLISKKSANNVQVCVDFVADSGGAGPNIKRSKRRLVLRENVNFVLGAEVPIELIARNNSRDIWRWVTNSADERELVFVCHRCQLVFIAAQEPTDYFNFIVDFHYEEKPLSRDGETPRRYEKTPSLIGEHRFLYAREWESDGK